MLNKRPNAKVRYEIVIKERLDPSWQHWFDELIITHDENDNTVLSGNIVDQAELHGVFKKIFNLGLTLISVNPTGIN